MQTISATLAAGVKQSFNVSDAQFFMLLETETALDVELFESNGGRSEMALSVESGYRERVAHGGQTINRVELTSATAQSVKFGYSVRDVDNRKVTSTVSVVSGEKGDSISGRSFFAKAFIGATAAQYSHIMLLNPAASGYRLLVESVAFASQTAGSIGVFYQTDGPSWVTAATTGEDPENKLLAGAASIAKIRERTVGSVLGTQLFTRRVLVDTSVRINFQKPIVIPEDYGLIIVNRTANADLFCDFQFTEEAL